MQTQPLKWFLPTFHGDIQLERVEAKVTTVRVFELTPTEEQAMERLRAKAVKKTLNGKQWASDKDFEPISSAQYRTKHGITIRLAAKIEDVQSVLAKALKPERKLLTAVKFTNGHIEEVHSIPSKEGPYRTPVIPEKTIVDEATPVAAATVAKPTVGCPMPEFPEADIRASRVLETFLDADQIKDYRSQGAFITVGADSGHRYLVANRERPNMLKKCGGRQLYDLEENRPLCIHDWSVPPPEEMLALHLLLTLKGNEEYIRRLPEAFETSAGLYISSTPLFV